MENLFPFENIDTLAETATIIAKELYKKDGFLRPLFLGYTANNKNRIFLPVEWRTDEEREAQLETVAALFCTYNVNKYVFLSEVTTHRFPESKFSAWDAILGRRVVSTKYLNVTVVTKKENRTLCYEVCGGDLFAEDTWISEKPTRYDNLDNSFCHLLVNYDKLDKRKIKTLIKKLEQDGKFRFDVLGAK